MLQVPVPAERFAKIWAASLVVVLTAYAVVVAVRRPAEPGFLEQRGQAAGYKVLLVGMIVVGCVLPFSESGWDIVQPAVLSMGLAELVASLVIVRTYRRG